MEPSENLTITQKRLIVCEGASDKAFLEHLLPQHGITGFQVECPTEATVGAGGFDQIGRLLLALRPKFWKTLTGLWIVVDADDDPAGRFETVRGWLAEVGCGVAEPFRVTGGSPATGVFLMPGAGRRGTLEHLLLEAVFAVRPELERCVDEFAKCLVYPCSWPENVRAKMRLHALIAGSCEKHPAAALTYVWREKGNPIPIDSPSFNEIAEFLRQFPA